MSKSYFPWGSVLKFVCHSHTVLNLATKHGWLPGARYTNLRDVRKFEQLGFLDIDWRNYNFKSHLAAARATRPLLTVARDVIRLVDLPRIIDEAHELAQFSAQVIVVPKDIHLEEGLEERIPDPFLLGYSVRTRYGGTDISDSAFRRPVHLLGGRPDQQRYLAKKMNVVSFDCNRFTYDALFGDYFDGERFRQHPQGGYRRCLETSLENINRIWDDYMQPGDDKRE